MELPKDLIDELLEHLDHRDFFMLSATGATMHRLLADTPHWQWNSITTEMVCQSLFVNNENVFLTGPAGTGKSYAINEIFNRAKSRSLPATIVSTTAISACNFDKATTLDSFFGITPDLDSVDKFNPKKINYFARSRIWKTKLLLLDEVSMLSATKLELMDIIAKEVRRSKLPMGGMRIFVSGDFYQLPPIGDAALKKNKRLYAFHSLAWEELKFRNYRLSVPMRHNGDLFYYNMLQRIRVGQITENDIKILEARSSSRSDDEIDQPMKIYAVNEKANARNREMFDAVSGEISSTSVAEDMICEKHQHEDGKIEYLPTNESITDAILNKVKNRLHKYPETLQFKVGAQYVITKNISLKEGTVNGRSCIYRGMNHGVGVTLPDGRMAALEMTEIFLKLGDGKYFRRLQYPLKLGYASTIHSSQGMTLERADIDLAKCFEDHQVYVALSRVKSLAGLYLTNFNVHQITVSNDVRQFYRSLEFVN